ncbi:MAG: head GIN domain-containing protein [Crocinitomicaceae bacterium]
MATLLSFHKTRFFFFILILGLISCKKVDAGKGEVIDQRLDVADFNKIHFSIGGQLNYTQESKTSVQITTSEKVADALDIYVEDMTLYIKAKDKYVVKNSELITINVTDNDVYDITVSGSGNVSADFDPSHQFNEHHLRVSGSGNITANEVATDQQTSTISGSGNISYDWLNATEALCNISGSGNVTYAGNVNQLETNLSGNGHFYGFEMDTYDATVNVSGEGNAEVRVQHQLNANISGSGNISYKGSPILVTAVSGTGKMIDAN